jgi:XTP/dITP diphosphohydrolase
MHPRRIVLATRNPGKVREIRAVLGELPVELAGLGEFGGVIEPHENGPTFAENACTKALHYARATGQWCLADDSGLEVDALDGRPGVTSARYAADSCPPGAEQDSIDRANNARLLKELGNIPDVARSARFVCHLALADPQRVLVETFDTIEGQIGRQPRGSNGFGYDPLFYLPARGRTTAELSPEDKNAISHRGKAARHMAGVLRRFLSDGI